MMLSSFYEKTSFIISGTVYVDEVATALDATDVFTFMMKYSFDDEDDEAAVTITGVNGVETGSVTFSFTVEDTTITPATYHYFVKWEHGDDAHIVETGTVTVNKNLFD
jgi:hypothetical protein